MPSPPTVSAFSLAFDQWLARRPGARPVQQASSVAVYRSMWEAFTRWCVGNGLTLASITAADVEAFVCSRAEPSGLSDRHAWRLLSLLDAVMRGAQTSRDGSANRAAAELLLARPEWRYANAADRDPQPEHLSPPQARQLVTWLLDDHAAPVPAVARPGSWQALRNRCSVALQLGAGLTPGDVRACAVDGVLLHGTGPRQLPGRLRIPAHGAAAEREAPVAVWAGRLLSRWLATRASLGIPGTVLFPGTRKGRPWTKVAQYNAAGSVLAAAGIEVAGGGSFLLRHTFALRQLRRGHDPAEVARWLGVVDPGVMARYERVVFDADIPD
jgi:integrase